MQPTRGCGSARGLRPPLVPRTMTRRCAVAAFFREPTFELYSQRKPTPASRCSKCSRRTEVRPSVAPSLRSVKQKHSPRWVGCGASSASIPSSLRSDRTLRELDRQARGCDWATAPNHNAQPPARAYRGLHGKQRSLVYRPLSETPLRARRPAWRQESIRNHHVAPPIGGA